MTRNGPIRVLVVDDSAIVRKVLSTILGAESDIEVVGTAPDPYIARDRILSLKPDVLTLDIEMPRMDGLTFLERIMRFHPLPVIVISSLAQSSTKAAMEALSRGAVDVLAKPGGPYSVGDLKEDLPRRVRAAASARTRSLPEAAGAPESRAGMLSVAVRAAAPAPAVAVAPVAAMPRSAHPGAAPGTLIAIGASTGGTQAIERVIRELPPETPPIVIAQHIPPVFSAAFADRLNRIARVEVREARGEEMLEPGLVLVAPGGKHLVVVAAGPGRWRARLDDGPKVCYQKPSVDVLFQSVAREAGSKALGVILTGMGSDGADGLAAMRAAGAWTVAQDEASCVVFGMPREAIERNAAIKVLPLDQIGAALLRQTSLAHAS
jgi:two-component system, chemotaxis family, protein-glutamate methylesterase/glutaminase